MKTYRIIFAWSADVEAENEDEAYEKAEQMFKKDIDFAAKYGDISAFGFDIHILGGDE